MGEKVVQSFSVSEEVLHRAKAVAKELGYRSFSQFVEDLLREVITGYETMKKLEELDRKARARKIISLSFLKGKLRL